MLLIKIFMIKNTNIILVAVLIAIGILLFFAARTDVNKTKITILLPDSTNPASGICADAPQKTNTVVLTIHENGPSPRCQQINPNQIVTIRNDTATDFNFSLGQNKDFSSAILAHGEYKFPVPAGELLAPGVHKIALNKAPYIGTELWLR